MYTQFLQNQKEKMPKEYFLNQSVYSYFAALLFKQATENVQYQVECKGKRGISCPEKLSAQGLFRAISLEKLSTKQIVTKESEKASATCTNAQVEWVVHKEGKELAQDIPTSP